MQKKVEEEEEAVVGDHHQGCREHREDVRNIGEDPLEAEVCL